MAQTIKLKRSSTGGAVPSTSSLSLGEVAINTYDGKMYIKKNDGSDAIVEIGAGTSAVWKSYDYTATSSQTSFSGNDNNSDSLSYVAGFVQVFLNGILLDPAVDYTATTGSSIVLTSGASTGDLLQIESFTQIIGTGDILVDTFPVSSTQTAFTLSQDPVNKSNISVYVEGVYQESSTYSLSTTTLTLSESPANGTTVEVVIGTRNVTLDNIADLTISGTLHAGALDLGDANIINVNEISLDTIKGDADANTNITFAGSDVTTFTQGGQERLRLNTTGAQVTGNIVVSGTVDGRDVAADGVTADAALSRAGGAMGGAITTNSTFDGRDVSVDGTKLDGIESGATADQTDVEIRAAVESASDSNVFTNADHSKLDAIEASADVTDATNVTAAGALMRAGGTMTGGLSGTTASFSSTVSASEYDLPSGGMLDWANGDARIVEGLVNNYSLSFQTYDGSTASTALRLDGNNAATFAGTISSGAISATGSANSGSASHLPAFLASGNYGGGIATRDTKESGWYQQTNGADWHFYHNRTVASDTPTSKIVLSFNSSGNATFAGTISSGAITSTSSMNAAGGYYVSGTEVIDASRNLTSIGNITTAGSTSIQTAGTNTNMTIGTSVSGSTGLLKLISTGDIQLYQYGTSWSTNVTFKGDGNVGIGTPTPYGLTHWQKSSTVNLVATNTGADGQADTTVMSLIGQARGYSNNLSKLASIDFKTDPTTWYYGAITFNVANLDGTDTSRTPLEAMRINRLGNVGIGTTAPEKNLSIGSSQAEGIQFNFDTTNNYRNQILNYWNSSADSRMDFNVARASGATPSTIMSVGHNSNVGIGTTSPTSKLEVIVTQSDTMTDDTAAFAIKGNGGDGILMGQRATAPYAAWIAAGYLPNIGTSHNYPLALQPHGGSVGIGTTSPAQALQVNGNIRINHPDGGLCSRYDSSITNIWLRRSWSRNKNPRQR